MMHKEEPTDPRLPVKVVLDSGDIYYCYAYEMPIFYQSWEECSMDELPYKEVIPVEYIQSWKDMSIMAPETDKMLRCKDKKSTHTVICFTKHDGYVLDNRVLRGEKWEWAKAKDVLKWRKIEEDYESILSTLKRKKHLDYIF